MNYFLNFVLILCLFTFGHSAQAGDCSKKSLVEAGILFWKKHQCSAAELEKINHCNLKTNKLDDEDALPFYFANILLKDKLERSELDRLQFPKAAPTKDDLKNCVRKVSVYFSLKSKDVLVYAIHHLREEATPARCQTFLKSLDDLYEDPLKSKLKFCSLLNQSPPQKTLKAFCQNFKEGCFFIR